MSNTRLLLVGVLILCAATILALSGCPAPSGSGPSSEGGAPPPAASTATGTTISQLGSTTVLPIAEKWATAYHAKNPQANINVTGGGSGAGIKALIGKTCDLADSSRAIKPEEIKSGQAAGVTPKELKIAYDGIAIIVNPACTLKEISIEKLSDAFTGKIKDWKDLGGSAGAIQLVNRESSSGTYDSFKEMVVTLGGKAKERDFAPNALSQTSSEGVLTTVAGTKTAIGYVGLGYVNSTVKVLAVIPLGGGKPAILPSAETVRAKTYPISRELYVYTNGEPTGILKAYLDWAVGPEGQRLVKEAGYVPLT